ncbi:N-acetylglucosamine-6-phosphate deacetylase [Paracoccus halophilus]|uniref:N-acetylglucosamine-6-phosphate deacetylase n=1 Tax=Paracoccus halophilus TaxID=376733 RepID=A0A099F7S5_9RHOB|nr:N-acetylglucosamine-6-phosphate deacetylase [Paracoccus halophilus]KGJ06504.1 N-acetylglucosamine-6-phosphate deacetylase [Paracoccus halophilus]SFA37936.1 N-acetylglucosamine-6-phosphate deacetylase [Paracoccus halophilus]
MRHILAGARLFDGAAFRDDHALVIADGRIEAILPAAKAGPPSQQVSGIIAPGFLDLQVNGGGGVMVDGAIDAAALRHICATHRRLGCAGILPTLITDTAPATARVIATGIEAARAGVPGFLGLHLEGPHLDPRRKGAHDPALIRPMTDEDLARLCEAAQALPVLMVTLAPENATPEQIAALSGAGALVSLGHSDCDFETAQAAFRAGASCATHLFNAMSQLGHRAPGLVGAVLAGGASAGLIADAIHAHPAAMRAALSARAEGVFLVTDCMAFAGTDQTEMMLHGRTVLRRDGRLTLPDGTLAGADLRMDRAVATLVGKVGIAPERALSMATLQPARTLGLQDRYGRLAPGCDADLILLDETLALRAVWQDDGWQSPLPG